MPTPQHILITGASSGLGAALAEHYAAPGVTLSLQGRDETRLDAVAEKAKQRGARVRTKILDVTDAEGMKVWIEDCAQTRPLDLVIANAGISAGTGRGCETEEQSRAIFATNVGGVINTVAPAVKLMKPLRRGQIAIMSSLASFRGLPGAPSYCASKAAVRIYGEALRSELRPFGVRVNVLCPGFIKTPLTAVNRFPMPFLMSASGAAAIIRRGLTKDTARIAFPWRLYVAVKLLSALPQNLTDSFVFRLPRKT
ncbi:MAG: SDR family NAD(P)-dependent oxidoreductase [Alphaproteobacteria bacterium]|nr:SDR family NAD(P)-dependent oxidoreductase [Alphaproteobacteria bacterium]